VSGFSRTLCPPPPQGMEAKEHNCLIIKKTNYGLALSVREFYQKLVLVLKGCNFNEIL
jgi:hypothetical protein